VLYWFSFLFREQNNSCDLIYSLGVEEKVQLRGRRLAIVSSLGRRMKVQLRGKEVGNCFLFGRRVEVEAQAGALV